MNSGVSQQVQEIVDQHYAGQMPSLHLAARDGHLELVRALLAQGANIEARNNFAETPLHKAVYKGDLKMVRELLAQGANSEARNNFGDTPLHRAAYWGHLEVVRELLGRGANVNARSNSDETPLHYAALEGQLDVVRELLALAANTEACNSFGDAPLHYATRSGHLTVVRELLAQGVNNEVCNNFDRTPLEMARVHGHVEIVDFLETYSAECKQWVTLCGLWRYGLYDESVAENAPPARSYDSYVAWLPEEILKDILPGAALIFSGKVGTIEPIVAIDNAIEQTFTQERQQRQSRHIARP